MATQFAAPRSGSAETPSTEMEEYLPLDAVDADLTRRCLESTEGGGYDASAFLCREKCLRFIRAIATIQAIRWCLPGSLLDTEFRGLEGESPIPSGEEGETIDERDD
jgi:hypothetical protein